jgi:hypothetical protein
MPAVTGALDATLARIAAADANGYGLAIGRRDQPGDGWLDARELVREPLDELIRDSTRGAGTPLARVGAEWLLELYAWQGASLVAAAMVSDARVPDLSPANVLVAVDAGRPVGIALRGGTLIGLPEDPRAHELDLVDDEPALARAGHDALASHVEPLIDALAVKRLRAPRALWRAAGDRVGQAFLWCTQAFDAPERSARLARLMIAPPSPMHVPLRTAVGDDDVPYHVRSSCCLGHRTDDPVLCPGCPLWRSRKYLGTAG